MITRALKPPVFGMFVLDILIYITNESDGLNNRRRINERSTATEGRDGSGLLILSTKEKVKTSVRCSTAGRERVVQIELNQRTNKHNSQRTECRLLNQLFFSRNTKLFDKRGMRASYPKSERNRTYIKRGCITRRANYNARQVC